MAQSHVHFEWQPRAAWRDCRTGVSLHSHTAHSREPFDFVPRLKRSHPWLTRLLEPLERRFLRFHDEPLDYSRIWWTPPLSAREALDVERTQITSRFGMRPLVSISDHDNIEAPLMLRVLPSERHTPISVEWTVPWRDTTFHLGIHNLPARSARERMKTMSAFTSSPHESNLPDLLDWLAEDTATLIVFNHPFWDEHGAGREIHGRLAREFANRYSPWLHAFELNGLRHWKENRQVLAWAVQSARPAISGGDRHTCEPNALTNVTSASTFAEFVQEVRVDRVSRMVVMLQYRESMTARICAAVADAIRENVAHGYGWTRWTERVFWQDARGETRSIASFFGRDVPPLIGTVVALSQLLDWRGVRSALRLVSPPLEEFGL